MRPQKIFINFLFTITIILCVCESGFAQQNAGFISYHELDNKSVYQRSDVRMAIDHFCRMVSINPRGDTIRENLKSIRSHPQLNATQKSDVILLEDHLRYIENLQNRVRYLTLKRDFLRDQLLQTGYDRKTLLKRLSRIRKNISDSFETSFGRGKSQSDQKNPIVVMNDLLAKEKERLSLQVRLLQDQYDWLKLANRGDHLLPAQNTIESRKEEIAFSEDHAESAIVPVIKIESQESDQRLEIKQDQVDKDAEPKTNREEESRDLENQIIDLSLKLTETEMQLKNRSEQVESLTGQLTDIEQRFMLGQRIIEEKDEKMQSLEENLQKVQLESESRIKKYKGMIATKDHRLAELEGFLNLAREDLADSKEQVQERLKNLRAMKEELAEVQERVRLGQKAVREKGIEIENRRSQWMDQQTDFPGEPEDYRALLRKKDKELKQLNAFLNIYRQGLGEANKIIKQKKDRAELLEKELSMIQDRISDRAGEEGQKDYLIRFLKEKLLVEREKQEKYADDLQQTVLKREQKIKDLNMQLIRTQRNLQIAHHGIQEKAARLDRAKKELVLLKRSIAQKDRSVKLNELEELALSDKKLTEMNGILEIYKDKLFEETKAAEKRAANITALEKQLAVLENELDEKNDALAQTQRSLNDLANQLSAMKEELLRLREYPQEDGSLNKDVDQQVGKIQSKFRDINHFLLENLHDSDKIQSHLVVQ